MLLTDILQWLRYTGRVEISTIFFATLIYPTRVEISGISLITVRSFSKIKISITYQISDSYIRGCNILSFYLKRYNIFLYNLYYKNPNNPLFQQLLFNMLPVKKPLRKYLQLQYTIMSTNSSTPCLPSAIFPLPLLPLHILLNGPNILPFFLNPPHSMYTTSFLFSYPSKTKNTRMDTFRILQQRFPIGGNPFLLRWGN